MRYIIILLASALSLSCQHGDNTAALIAGNLPEVKAEYQKQIIGQLSGKFELADQTLLKSRWSQDERDIARQYLKELIATMNLEPKEHHYTSPNMNPAVDLILGPFRGVNVYGILPSTNHGEEYIVLGAHYDTGRRGAPGAIDNATGIALIYSVVKEIAKSEDRDRNIIIVFFDQEEEELIGSKAFAAFMREKQWDIHSVHCFDMVGWDGDNDRAMEMFSASESLLNTYKTVALRHQIPLKDIIVDTVGYDNNSTDFDAFVPFGFDVIGAGECYYHKDATPYKDSPDDTFETVDFQYLLGCSNLIEDIIREITTE